MGDFSRSKSPLIGFSIVGSAAARSTQKTGQKFSQRTSSSTSAQWGITRSFSPFGSSKRLLALFDTFCRFWHFLGRVDAYWHLLSRFGTSWHSLALPGVTLSLLGLIGTFWRFLALVLHFLASLALFDAIYQLGPLEKDPNCISWGRTISKNKRPALRNSSKEISCFFPLFLWKFR